MNLKISKKIKKFFSEYFEISKKIGIYPPEFPIKLKFYKFYEKNKLITGIIIMIIILILSGSIEIFRKTNLKPNLEFNDVIFEYQDFNGKLVGNSRNTEYINLEKISKINLYAEIINNGEINLLYSLKYAERTSPDGTTATSTPDFPKNNVFLGKGKSKKFTIYTIDAEKFYELLKSDRNFYLKFKLKLEYFTEDKREKIYNVDNTFVECLNFYQNTKLPNFTPSCTIKKI
ncbi:MAG: hypothetical protein PHZ04_03770 [Patescibacteria group bacterium]|nr:hypothetical protein [Patescibacteria group bacterium]MDD5295022.1 hypothetical protein [Patescibacteria group bacterium]MDD5554268.1 hypothetical protein [Patescibacteria group bacterium]